MDCTAGKRALCPGAASSSVDPVRNSLRLVSGTACRDGILRRCVALYISSPLVKRFGEKGWVMHTSSLRLIRDRHINPLSWASRDGAVSQGPKSMVQASKVAPMNEWAVPERSDATGNPRRAMVVRPDASRFQCCVVGFTHATLAGSDGCCCHVAPGI